MCNCCCPSTYLPEMKLMSLWKSEHWTASLSSGEAWALLVNKSCVFIAMVYTVPIPDAFTMCDDQSFFSSTGHYLDQKRLKQGLYRHPWDDISYVLPEHMSMWSEGRIQYLCPTSHCDVSLCGSGRNISVHIVIKHTKTMLVLQFH